MDKATSFEDLSNDIFCELFDYFNAFDLFLAFDSLNVRISSVFKYIRLHIIIHPLYYRHQILFLSRYLTFHSHQVVSLDISDKICDQRDTIAYLFDRHEFPILHSCIFRCLNVSSKLNNAINQLKKQTQLVSFHLFQLCDVPNDVLIRHDAHLFSEMFFLNIPCSLRCDTLRLLYDYPELITNTITNSSLTYLELLFTETFRKISIYSLIHVLRIHKSLRQLNVIIKSLQRLAHHTDFK
jgi:hypothetical protein